MMQWLSQLWSWLSAVGFWFDSWARVSTFEIKDWLGIIGFLLGGFNLLYARRKDRREPVRVRIFQHLDDLRISVVQLDEDIEKHLCFEPGRKTKEDIYRAEAKARHHRAHLEEKLPTCSDELFRLYTAWWNAASGDGFPLQNEQDKYRRNDTRISRVSDATAALINHLEIIRSDCVSGRIKYWKCSKKKFKALPRNPRR